MSYRAKKPRKKKLRIVLEKCWLVSVVDENDNELDSDFCFLPRENALAEGKKMKRELLKELEGYE